MIKIGIYKIENLINHKCYIGQSRNINKRWTDHRVAAFNKNDKGYDYPLYRAIRKYGLNNFDFSIIEECSIKELNEKEKYWISFYQAEYNQTEGGDYAPVPQKLTLALVSEIQQILINDEKGEVSHKELAEKYGVHKDTIRDINVGRTWKNDKLEYPLHLSKFDPRRGNNKEKFYCKYCGKEVSKGKDKCHPCYLKHRQDNKKYTNEYISREDLKEAIRTETFTAIGRRFNVNGNSVKKWCDGYKLPRLKSEIKKYSDEEWEYI